MTHDELEDLIYERTRSRAARERTRCFVYGSVADCILELVAAEREAWAKENAELLQALQNLHQRCHWSDAPEEMDAAKAVIEKAIRARGVKNG